MSDKKEFRNAELRAAQGEEFVLQGRACTYNQISSNELAPGLRERILPGAFSASLAAGQDVIALFNHQERSTLPLGRLSTGTLKVSDSPEGLDFRIALDRNNPYHQSVYSSVKRGDLSECSFCMVVEEDNFSDATIAGRAAQIRNVRRALLLDLSVVSSPFYGAGATNVDARAADANNVEARKRWLAEQQADWARRDRAHEIGMQVLHDIKLTSETRDMSDFASMRDKLQAEMCGYSYVGHDDDYVYGVSEDDEEDNSIYRFGYELDAQGNVTLHEASRTQFTQAEVSGAVRSAVCAAFEERDLKFRMQAASGRTVR